MKQGLAIGALVILSACGGTTPTPQATVEPGPADLLRAQAISDGFFNDPLAVQASIIAGPQTASATYSGVVAGRITPLAASPTNFAGRITLNADFAGGQLTGSTRNFGTYSGGLNPTGRLDIDGLIFEAPMSGALTVRPSNLANAQTLLSMDGTLTETDGTAHQMALGVNTSFYTLNGERLGHGTGAGIGTTTSPGGSQVPNAVQTEVNVAENF